MGLLLSRQSPKDESPEDESPEDESVILPPGDPENYIVWYVNAHSIETATNDISRSTRKTMDDGSVVDLCQMYTFASNGCFSKSKVIKDKGKNSQKRQRQIVAETFIENKDSNVNPMKLMKEQCEPKLRQLHKSWGIHHDGGYQIINPVLQVQFQFTPNKGDDPIFLHEFGVYPVKSSHPEWSAHTFAETSLYDDDAIMCNLLTQEEPRHFWRNEMRKYRAERDKDGVEMMPSGGKSLTETLFSVYDDAFSPSEGKSPLLTLTKLINISRKGLGVDMVYIIHTGCRTTDQDTGEIVDALNLQAEEKKLHPAYCREGGTISPISALRKRPSLYTPEEEALKAEIIQYFAALGEYFFDEKIYSELPDNPLDRLDPSNTETNEKLYRLAAEIILPFSNDPTKSVEDIMKIMGWKDAKSPRKGGARRKRFKTLKKYSKTITKHMRRPRKQRNKSRR